LGFVTVITFGNAIFPNVGSGTVLTIINDSRLAVVLNRVARRGGFEGAITLALRGASTFITGMAHKTNTGSFSVSDGTTIIGVLRFHGGTVVLGRSTGRGGGPDTGTGIVVGTNHTLRHVRIVTLSADEVSGGLTELGAGSFRGDVLSPGGGRAVIGDQGTLGLVGPDTTARVVVSTSTTNGVSGDLVPANVAVEGAGTFHSDSGAAIRGTLGSLGTAVILDGMAATSPCVGLVIPSNAAGEAHRALTGGTVEGRAGGACHFDTGGGITDGTGTTRGEFTTGGGGFVTEDIPRVGLVTGVTVEGTLLVNVGGVTTIGRVGHSDGGAVIHDLTASGSGGVSARGWASDSTNGRVAGSVTEVASEGASITDNTGATYSGDLAGGGGGGTEVRDGLTLGVGEKLTLARSVTPALDPSTDPPGTQGSTSSGVDGSLVRPVSVFTHKHLIATNDVTGKTRNGVGNRNAGAIVGDSRTGGGRVPGTG
jgi:hypothetical protein